uniref:Uncharacterized protein n=1 Tax=Megaselia scalaris TaxID=36166 RepID=T1GNC0_MEGSC
MRSHKSLEITPPYCVPLLRPLLIPSLCYQQIIVGGWGTGNKKVNLLDLTVFPLSGANYCHSHEINY